MRTPLNPPAQGESLPMQGGLVGLTVHCEL